MTTKLEKMTDKFWPELAYPLSFTDALATLTKQQLTNIRMNLQISNLSNLNKQALADKLAETIAEHLWTTTRCWDHARMKLVQKIAKNGGLWDNPLLEIQQYEYFRERGILFPGSVDGKRVVVMPAELVALFQAGELFLEHPIVDRNTEWIKLIRGLLFYYGTLPNEELSEHLFEHAENKLAPFDFYNILIEAGAYYEEIDLSEAAYVSDSRVMDTFAIRKERALRSELEYRFFTRQQLLKAGEPNFVERDSHYASLVRFVLDRYEIDREEADLMAEVCVDAAKNGASLHEVLEEAMNFVEMPGIETVNAFADLLVPLMNHTKQYIIKGYSPAELSAKRASASMVLNTPAAAAEVIDIKTKKKIGRNDPCPCGSGKKYKKCCG